MTITRVVNGKSMQFALNADELYRAYVEQQNRYAEALLLRVHGIRDASSTRIILKHAERIESEYGYSFEAAIDQAVHELCLN